jgi:PII-like signaling protein
MGGAVWHRRAVISMPNAPNRRVRFYTTEADRGAGHPLARALVDLLRAGGARGVTVFRGAEGFGGHRRVHSDLHVDVVPELPVVLEWIEDAEAVRRILPRAAALAPGALITQDGLAAGEGAPPPGGVDMEGGEHAVRVRIYLGQADRAGGRPAHLAILELLRAGDAQGATVFGGIEGFGAGGEVHGERLADLGRRLPVVIEWIDHAEAVARLLARVRALVPAALVTVEDTTVVQWPRAHEGRPGGATGPR